MHKKLLIILWIKTDFKTVKTFNFIPLEWNLVFVVLSWFEAKKLEALSFEYILDIFDIWFRFMICSFFMNSLNKTYSHIRIKIFHFFIAFCEALLRRPISDSSWIAVGTLEFCILTFSRAASASPLFIERINSGAVSRRTSGGGFFTFLSSAVVSVRRCCPRDNFRSCFSSWSSSRSCARRIEDEASIYCLVATGCRWKKKYNEQKIFRCN